MKEGWGYETLDNLPPVKKERGCLTVAIIFLLATIAASGVAVSAILFIKHLIK